ncbi:hypothetical protein ACTFIV_010144 [Dictyostelium citrinum]
MKDNIIFSILIIASIVFAVTNSQSVSQPKTLTMKVTVYDQHVFYNDNFENQGPAFLTKGMVVSTLDKSLKYPQLVTQDVNLAGKTGVNYYGTMYNPKLFKYFFSENANASPTDQNSGRNFPLLMDLILTLNDSTGAYEFSKQTYFPINGKGFNDPSYPVPPKYKAVYPNVDWFKMTGLAGFTQNNYNYCIKLNSKFTYFEKGEVFNFRGDDDVWVFIDNRLVVDLGGLHTAETGNIKLSDIKNPPLQKNKIYDLDFFYCERRASQSSIQLSTTLEIFCVNDYCGVCNGDGTSCCTSSTCEDNNACTIDKCPKLGTVAEGKFTVNDCVHTEVVCPKEADQCLSPYCDSKEGCKTSPVVCESGNTDKCFEQSGTCDSAFGCQYEYKCTANGKCDLGCEGGECRVKNSTQCAEEFGNDPCYTYSCDYDLGCVRTEKCPQDEAKLCTINTCNKNAETEDERCYLVSIQEQCDCCADETVDPCQLPGCGAPGECKPVDKIIDDNNLCTIDKCENGTITHTPVKCGGCSQCDLKTGQCVANQAICDDDNVCTIDSCSLVQNEADGSFNGVCENEFVNCALNDTNLCNIWTCDAKNGGCQKTEKVCEDPSPCTQSRCEQSTGECVNYPRVCSNGGAFCLIAECDERLGCIVYDRQCASDDRKCQAGVCVNGTNSEDGHCKSVDYDPLPFGCNTAAVVSTAVIAGVTVAAVVGLGIFLYGGKKGYDYWQDNKSKGMTGANSNPLYKESDNAGQNPLYNDNNL